MKIFLAGTSLRPAYGGPAVSVSNLAAALGDVGAEVGLWAADGSTADASLASRVRMLQGDAAQALEAFDPDLIHDNGLWLAHNHRLAALALQSRTPRIVSTRGMLAPWALTHKRWKKRLAWAAYQRRDLAGASLHHATSEAEADDVGRLDLNVPVCVIPNGVELPDLGGGDEAPRPPVRTALFLGRIYPVKGLPMLIEAWAKVRPAGWRLQIAGPDEGGHRAEVERAAAAAGLGDVVSFSGPLSGGDKRRALLAADLLVLPSHSESFGMVVAEALAHALPVLTTDAVPWRALTEQGCGWRTAATAEGLAEGLREATSTDRVRLRSMGRRGRDVVAAEHGWAKIANRFLTAYEQALAGSAQVAEPLRRRA